LARVTNISGRKKQQLKIMKKFAKLLCWPWQQGQEQNLELPVYPLLDEKLFHC
jgi:hypothetical protein